jgi:hypothetical protein
MKSKDAVCSGRERYWSEKEAYAAARGSEESHFQSPSVKAYICRECIGWHLTTQVEQNLN